MPDRGREDGWWMVRLGAPSRVRAVVERLKNRFALPALQLGLAEMDESRWRVPMRTDEFEKTLGPLMHDCGAGPMGYQLVNRYNLRQLHLLMKNRTLPRTD